MLTLPEASLGRRYDTLMSLFLICAQRNAGLLPYRWDKYGHGTAGGHMGWHWHHGGAES